MSNVRFILDNTAVDSATLSTASAAIDASYPVENIQRISRSKPIRSVEAANTLDIKGTLSSTVDVSALVLARHNFTQYITYQLFLYSDTNWSNAVSNYTAVEYNVSSADASVSGLYQWGEFSWGSITWGADKPNVDNRQFYDIVLWLDNIHTIQSYIIRLNITDGIPIDAFYCDEATITCDDTDITCDMLGYGSSGAPAGDSGIPYYEIGRVYLGEYLEPAYNLSLGHSISWDENTTQYRPSSGTLRSDTTTSNKRFEFDLKTIPETDRDNLHRSLIDKGLRDDFYVSIFPDDDSNDKEVDYSSMVKFTKVPKYTNFINEYYKSKFVMEEI
jgi:hypothetical protein